MLWETTYLGNLCELMKYFEATLGGLGTVNQWAVWILTERLLVDLSLPQNTVKHFIIRKDFLNFSNCWQREAMVSEPVLGNNLFKN